MLNVVTSDRFSVLLMIGQYLPLQMHFTDKVLLLFSQKPAVSDPMQTILSKLSLLPWEDRKEACTLALPLLQQGWQQLNKITSTANSFSKASQEFYRGQLYCFQGLCAVVNDDATQPQLVFDYISKAREAFSLSHDQYNHSTSTKAIALLDTLIKNTPAKKNKIFDEEDAVSHSSLGRQYIEQKKWALAHKHFKKAHKKSPSCPIHQTEKTLSAHLKQISELHYLCQTTPIVIRQATQKRYVELINENLNHIEELASKAHKSLILNEIDVKRWINALSHFQAKNVK